jgi:peptidoglycan/LPS O-acetylase OafA/YrhL
MVPGGIVTAACGVLPHHLRVTASTTPSERWRLGYRPALDGIRGIAILLVLLSHARLGPFAGGGLTGVTLFFVLSGYLITSLLLREHERDGRISLPAFYLRRARRLLPALVALVAVVTSVALVAGAGTDALTDAAAALFYVGNWATIPEGGLGLGTLSHTWSLAVEEHFYLLWPLVMIVALPRLSRNGMLVLLAVGILGSAALRAALVASDASVHRVAFGSDTRAEALLIGCAIALLPAARLPVIVPLVGLVIGGVLMRYTPGGLTLGLSFVTLASAAAVVGVADGHGWLGWRPLALLGRISYGVYLWHYPLMFGLARHYGWEGALWGLGLTLASIAIAAASYRWIESPFLAGPRRGERATLAPSRAG